MRCQACGYDGYDNFEGKNIPFIMIEVSSNDGYSNLIKYENKISSSVKLYACPKCKTVRME